MHRNGVRKSRKQSIVEAATRMFAEQGFASTSVAELAAATGVAEGTIFYHFTTKEDLFLHILGTMRDDIVREFQGFARERAPQSGLDMLDEAISFYLYLAGRMEGEFRLLHRHFPYRLAETNPACREHLEKIYSCLVDIFEESIRIGQRDGSIADLPTRKMALLVFTMVDGLVRLRHFNLYDAPALHGELVAACRRMLARDPETPRSNP